MTPEQFIMWYRGYIAGLESLGSHRWTREGQARALFRHPQGG
jgi:hypothetical protein